MSLPTKIEKMKEIYKFSKNYTIYLIQEKNHVLSVVSNIQRLLNR